MAIVVTATSGYDLGYVWHNQAGQKSAAGYYIDAKDAEDKGRWFGPGLAVLGLEDGSEVERDHYDAVYRQVNPATGERFGSRPGKFPSKQDHLARLLAAERHATAERLIELEREAAAMTRETPAYTDMTVSFSKSISLLEASIRANAHHARVNGGNASYWDARLERLHAILQDANRAGLEHAQRWAGVTRVGSMSQRYEPADLVVSSWLQGLSRSGSPQLHTHNQFARMTFTQSGGKARALASMALRAQLPAVNGIVAAHAESALAREFGVGWRARADGKGNEVAGVTEAEMRVFSERTQDIEEKTRDLITKWTERNGRQPTSYELLFIQKKATMLTRAGKDDGAIDWGQKAEDWDRQIDQALGERLADIAPRVSGLGGDSAVRVPDPGGPPSPEVQLQSVRDAVEIVSSKRSAWTRADLERTLQTVLPTTGMAPDDAVALLDGLVDEATSGRLEEVVSLEAPEFPVLPDELRRELDGRSVYTQPGTTRYSSRAALDTEAQLVGDAQRTAAVRMTREEVARGLGVEWETLEQTLARGAGDGHALESGLRLDQGAALAYVLSSPRVAEVLVGPAGTGKTRTAGEAVRLWPGPVIGSATSQNATNELRNAGISEAWNTTQLIGRLERGQVAPGTLIWLDEGSMVSTTHMAQIVRYAARHGLKVTISGDQRQLEAVESGGGFLLLAHRLGYVLLAEPQRFAAEWERRASLQLRDGHASAIDVYSGRGRVRGGDPEQVMREAVRAYVAEYIGGRDVILTAASWDRCRELSRQIRADLKHLGKVDSGRWAELSEGQQASSGDLIIARENDHILDAGGRGLANGDVLMVDEVTEDGLLVRRLTGTDRDSGERSWSPQFRYRDLEHADLAYATTGHAAQGRTVDVGLTLVSGTETRQWLYAAMTRGVTDNTAFVITKPRKADPDPTLVAAPEIGRQAKEDAYRAGLEIADEPREERDVKAVLSDVLERDGSQLAALELQLRNLANADHLGQANVVFEDLTRGAQVRQYEDILRDALPPQFDDAELSHTATWLWRTVRQAEAAGLEADEVIRSAVEIRSLAGTRDVAAVIDARIRDRVGPMIPAEPKSWSERTPELSNPEVNQFVHELAGMMDRRAARLGDWTAEQQPAWLVSALGTAPEDPEARLEYTERTQKLAVYRELYNIEDPDEAIGPEPTWDSPEQRSRWHAAAMARGKLDHVDLADRADATLWHMRNSYETVTRHAPEHPGALLADVRRWHADAERYSTRAQAEAEVARQLGDEATAGRHETMHETLSSAVNLFGEQEQVLAAQAELRGRWSKLTEGSRLLAVAADTEMRRRYPEQKIDPLKSAEPKISDQDKAELSYTGNTLESAPIIGRLAERQAEHEERLSDLESWRMPDEDADMEDLGGAWGSWSTDHEQAIVQPPAEMIDPAPEIAGREMER